MSEVAKWLIVGLLALGAVLSISSVGKPRKPLEPRIAATVAVVNALVIAAILAYWGRS